MNKIMGEKNKDSSWRKFKNHIEMTKLSVKIGYTLPLIITDLEKLKDENKKIILKAEIEEIEIENTNFNGDDGSTENLESYKDIFTRLNLLKQKINNNSN